MHKIFRYECKRLLWNKFFLGLVLVLWFYGWQVLNNRTIFGVSHTAPFSSWSFGDYFVRMLPLLWIGALFFLTFFTSAKAQRVAILTSATNVFPHRYALTRCAAALTGTGLLMLVPLVQAAVFCGQYFGWRHGTNLLLPALFTLVPLLVFALGSGYFLGQIRSYMVYGWMPLPFLFKFLPLPEALGIWNGSFFIKYPLVLGTLDPAFTIPATVILAQCTLFTVGVGLLFFQPLPLHLSALKLLKTRVKNLFM